MVGAWLRQSGMHVCLLVTLQHYGFAVVSQKLVTRVRSAPLSAMLHQEIGWFDLDENSSGPCVSRLASDSAILQVMTSETLNRGLVNLTTIVISFAIAFFYSWQMNRILLANDPHFAGSLSRVGYILVHSGLANGKYTW